MENGPLRVSNLKNFKNSKGEDFESKPMMALCRCGGSANKPYCDGTHNSNGFKSEKTTDGEKNKRVNYSGENIAIHDNRGVCAHSAICSNNLDKVFRPKQEPWIDVNAAGAEEIIKVVRDCPSGALSYSVEGNEHKDQERGEGIKVSKDGPYLIIGGIELANEEFGEEASKEHYCLCRCGASKNKPFCDGSHWGAEFKDEKN